MIAQEAVWRKRSKGLENTFGRMGQSMKGAGSKTGNTVEVDGATPMGILMHFMVKVVARVGTVTTLLV